MRGAVSTVIAPWGMKKFLVLTDAQREQLRFHLDAAKATFYGTAAHTVHVHVARGIAGLLEDDKPARTRSVRSTSNHPDLAEYRNARRAA